MTAVAPNIMARKIGIVARDYNVRFQNGHRDFSHALPDVLKLLDDTGCDTVLFSLYSIIPRPDYNLREHLLGLHNIRMVCVEEFQDKPRSRKPGKYVVYHRETDEWQEYSFKQAFGRVNWQGEMSMVSRFAQRQVPRRIIGNCCILICGEANAVKYDKTGTKSIIDPCGVLDAIPAAVNLILSPWHDKTSRFELARKKQFLSMEGRTVVSVWNKGKITKTGQARDGQEPAWAVFNNGNPVPVRPIENGFGVDIGVLDVAELAE